MVLIDSGAYIPRKSKAVNKLLGVHRLSIINQSNTGNQPFGLNGVYLICNGQIYNYIELSKKFNIDLYLLRSDVDIILHLYNIFQNNIYELVNLLDGDFAFVLFALLLLSSFPT